MTYLYAVLAALAAALLLTAGYLIGAHRVNRYWDARYRRFAAGIEAGNQALAAQVASQRLQLEAWRHADHLPIGGTR